MAFIMNSSAEYLTIKQLKPGKQAQTPSKEARKRWVYSTKQL